MKAMKAAKMRKPTRPYVPERAVSMAKDIGVLSGRMTFIVGVPDSILIVECMPSRLTNALEASVLVTLRVEPNLSRMPDGNGVRKAKKATGKTAWRRVCGSNNTSVVPAVNIGRVKI